MVDGDLLLHLTEKVFLHLSLSPSVFSIAPYHMPSFLRHSRSWRTTLASNRAFCENDSCASLRVSRWVHLHYFVDFTFRKLSILSTNKRKFVQIAADYSGVDDSQLDSFLMSLSPELSVYTYNMLSAGINRCESSFFFSHFTAMNLHLKSSAILPSLTDEVMVSACGIANPIHRLKLKQAFQGELD